MDGGRKTYGLGADGRRGWRDGSGRADDPQDSRGAQVPGEGAPRFRLRALGGQDRHLQGRDDPRREGGARGLQGRRGRLLLGRLSPGQGVRAAGGQGGRGRRGQVERLPDGSHGPARRAGDQCPRAPGAPRHRRMPQLHDHRHRHAAQAAPRRRAPHAASSPRATRPSPARASTGSRSFGSRRSPGPAARP